MILVFLGRKKIIIIAGPKGAGKSTFAKEFLPHEAECPEFVNADLIAADLSPFNPDQVAVTAGRIMLSRIKELVEKGENFAFETTLASRIFLRFIPQWQSAGYCVKLYFLRLSSPEIAINRVAFRVRLGGHHIPEDTIRRRFERGLINLKNDYLHRVDEWAIYDANTAPPLLVANQSNATDQTLMEDPAIYRTKHEPVSRVQPLNDPDFIGAEAAFKRAADKIKILYREAGLEPVVAKPARPEEP